MTSDKRSTSKLLDENPNLPNKKKQTRKIKIRSPQASSFSKVVRSMLQPLPVRASFQRTTFRLFDRSCRAKQPAA